jgi:hypothetical protein
LGRKWTRINADKNRLEFGRALWMGVALVAGEAADFVFAFAKACWLIAAVMVIIFLAITFSGLASELKSPCA